MLLFKSKVSGIKKDYNFKLDALRESVKLIPLGQTVDSVIAIVMWLMFRNDKGNEYLWIPLLGTVIAGILWGTYAFYDCKNNVKKSEYIFGRHILLSGFASLCTNAFLIQCFQHATNDNKVLIIAVIIATATTGALSIASFQPVTISWLIPFVFVTIFSAVLLGSRWKLLWTLVLGIYYMMLTVECFIVSDAFWERYITEKTMENQNETIRELYELEKKYNEKISLYQSVLEQSPISVVITDTDGKIEYVNPYFTELTGYTLDEAIGENPRILKTEKTEKKIFEDLWDKLTHGEKWIGEFVNRRKNGEEYEESAVIAPIKNAENITTHYVGIKENITYRKQKELELKNALIRAEEATVAKSQFLANMSHEIRTPMNAVIGMSYLALKTNLEDKQKDYIYKINKAASSLLGIINDILDFSKIEAGKLELEYTEFSLDTVVTDAIGLFTQAGYEKGLEFSCHISPEIPRQLLGDPLRLRQVITNLVSNAVKFTEYGMVSIDIKLLMKSENKVCLQYSISDTGIGVSEEEQARLFQAFSQADNSTTRRFGGTGLGLAISTKLVDIMGGKIWVHSKIGEGSTFSFTSWLIVADSDLESSKAYFQESESKRNLVVDDSREAKLYDSMIALFQENSNKHYRNQEAVMEHYALGKLRILLVEDNEVNRQIGIELLEGQGIEVDIATNGVDAIKKFETFHEENPYHMILMDLQMPVMDGFEATKCIRKMNKFIPIIAMTARTMSEEKEECFKAGMNDHIAKPIDANELFSTIARWKPDELVNSKAKQLKINNDIEKTLDIAGVNTGAGIKRVAGNKKMYRELLLKYADIQSGIMEDIKMSAGKEDYQEVARLAHTLKGVSGNIGAEEIQKLSEKLEASIKNQIESNDIAGIIKTMEKVAIGILEDIKNKI